MKRNRFKFKRKRPIAPREIFSAMTGSAWRGIPVQRELCYRAPSVVSQHLTLTNVLGISLATIELYGIEPNHDTGIGLLTLLSGRLGRFQKKEPHQDFGILYNRIVDVANDHGLPEKLHAALLCFGVGVLRNERAPVNTELFDYVSDSLVRSCILTLSGDGAQYVLPLMKVAGSFLQKHTDFIDPRYIEICCNYLNIPVPPVPSEAKSPHAVLKNYAIQQDINVIKEIHEEVNRHLHTALEAYTNHATTFALDELFSHKTQELLDLCGHTSSHSSRVQAIARTLLHTIDLYRHASAHEENQPRRPEPDAGQSTPTRYDSD